MICGEDFMAPWCTLDKHMKQLSNSKRLTKMWTINRDFDCYQYWADMEISSAILTHWGKTTIIGSDNGLSPGRRQAIIWTNAGILLIGTLGTNFSEILFKCHSFSFKKMHMKILSGKWRPSCLGLNVLSLSWCVVLCYHCKTMLNTDA